MAPLRFAANLAWLFQEEPTLGQRMEAASRAGFRAVELAFPYASDAKELRAAAERHGLEVVLLNTPPGNQEKGDMGLGAVPGRQPEFREAVALAVKYAKELKCPRKQSIVHFLLACCSVIEEGIFINLLTVAH